MRLRLPRLSVKMLARVAAVALVAVAIMRAAVELSDFHSSRPFAAQANAVTSDALAAQLERCRHLTPERANDAACRRAWAESRRRFLGHHAGHGV